MIKKYLPVSLIASIWTAIFPQVTMADIKPIDGITNPVIDSLGNSPDEAASGSTFAGYFIYIWNSLIAIGAIMVIIFYLLAAIEWITAGGDSSKLEKARNRILQATIGLFILVTSYTIIGFLSNLLFGNNFNILNLELITPT